MHAVGYVRRSTDKQEMSLEQQRSKLEQFAAARGFKLAKIFSDDAISGSEMKRPGLESLLSYARSRGDVQAVITWERNRLARPKDPVDGLMLERELLTAGKRVLYAATGQEADRSFAQGLISYVEHFQSGDYLRKLSRDVHRGIVHRVERGLWPGGPIPFGYDRLVLTADGTPRRIVRDMPDRSQLVIDAHTGSVVERIAGGHRYSKQDFELCTLIPHSGGAKDFRGLRRRCSDPTHPRRFKPLGTADRPRARLHSADAARAIGESGVPRPVRLQPTNREQVASANQGRDGRAA